MRPHIKETGKIWLNEIKYKPINIHLFVLQYNYLPRSIPTSLLIYTYLHVSIITYLAVWSWNISLEDSSNTWVKQIPVKAKNKNKERHSTHWQHVISFEKNCYPSRPLELCNFSFSWANLTYLAWSDRPINQYGSYHLTQMVIRPMFAESRKRF